MSVSYEDFAATCQPFFKYIQTRDAYYRLEYTLTFPITLDEVRALKEYIPALERYAEGPMFEPDVTAEMMVDALQADIDIGIAGIAETSLQGDNEDCWRLS